MVVASCSHAVLEVSSHSLALDRVYGCEFKVAVFTNLTRDHLDFHGDMDRYFEAKRRLFDTFLRPDGRAVLNAEDDRTPALAAASRAPVWTYGIDRPADFQAEDIALSLEATRFRLRSPQGVFAGGDAAARPLQRAEPARRLCRLDGAGPRSHGRARPA